MTVEKAFTDALKKTPYPVTQKPIMGKKPVELCFFEVVGAPQAFASNRPQRIRHVVQVDIFAREAIAPERDTVIQALEAAGIQVASWGPAGYEISTRLHHLPITCYYTEPAAPTMIDTERND